MTYVAKNKRRKRLVKEEGEDEDEGRGRGQQRQDRTKKSSLSTFLDKTWIIEWISRYKRPGSEAFTGENILLVVFHKDINDDGTKFSIWLILK